MTLAPEGIASNTAQGQSSFSQSITTSGTDRILVMCIVVENQGAGPLRTVSGITTTGLTWTKYTSNLFGGNNSELEVWWAHAVTSGSYTAAVTLSGTADGASWSGFAVSGCTNFTNPFDVDVSLPAYSHNDSGGTVPVTGTFSTTAPNTIVFGFFGTNWFIGPESAPSSGFTQDENQANFNGGTSIGEFLEHQVYSSPQSGVTLTLPDDRPNWGFLIFALTDAAGGGGGGPASSAAAMLIGF